MKKQQPGLYLKDEVIRRISGPSGMYYLRPRPTGKAFGINNSRPDLPLVLLWGDNHRDDSSMCADCDCKSQQNCCHTTYDVDFLRKLDKMGEEYPIDFYTEFSNDLASSIAKDNKDILFKRFILDTTLDCHKKELRSQPSSSRCPTTFMRWHYADVRFMKHTVEHYIDRDIMSHLSRFHTTLTEYTIPKEDQNTSTPQKRSAYLNRLTVFFDTIQSHIIETTSSTAEHYKDLYEKGSELQNDIMLRLLAPSSNYKKATREENIREKYKDVFRIWVDAISDPKQSVFFKQLSKSGFPPITQKEWLVEFLSDCAFEFLYSKQAQNDIGFTYNSFEDYVNAMDSEYSDLLYSIFDGARSKVVYNVDVRRHTYYTAHLVDKWSFDQIKETLLYLVSELKTILLHITSIWVELYTIARMLKPPKDNSPPLLVFGYFGNIHSVRIARLLTLTKYFDYEIVYFKKNEEGDTFRCVTIDKPIMLYQDLVRHATSQYQYRKNKGYHNAYERVTLQERMGRSRAIPPSSLSRIHYSITQNRGDPSLLHVSRSLQGGKRAQRRSTKRQSTKRQSTKRQRTKRQRTKRQSTKRQSTRKQRTRTRNKFLSI